MDQPRRLAAQEKIDWAHVWRRLELWPDSVEGLNRLKKTHIISPMSNGNVALMAHLAKFAALPYGGGPAGVPDSAKSGDFDVVCVSIVDLAQQLGA